MDRQDRTTKKTLKALIVVGAILVLSLIAAIVYFYLIKGPGEEEEELDNITCGCYMIDPNVVNECGDPKRAFLFNLNTVSSDKTCSAICDINDVADNLLNSTTPKDEYKSCTVKSISDTRCENMILKDQNEKIITGRIQPTDEINVEATFDKSTYVDYTFKINSETTTPDKVDGNKITKKIKEFEGVNSVEIIATAKNEQGEQINSIVCRRIVDIQTASASTVTGIVATTEQQTDGKTKISQIIISVGQLTSENVKIRYSFSSGFSTLTAIDGITIESAKGTLSMSKLDLYDTNNFSSDSFNILNNHLGDLDITAEVFLNEASIGSASTTVKFIDSSTTPPVDDDPTIQDDEKSSFSATKTVAQTCVERTAGSNTATYTINVKNNKDVADSITSIKDKLPLGFIYTPNSSSIDGTATPDASLVTVTPVGDTQEVVWQPSTPWSIPADGTLAIVFSATAGTTAISGQNLNEIIVNPVEIPLDPATLRAQVYITLAQDCENVTEEEQEIPQTGIFDNFIVRIAFGILILLTGWLVYVRPEGNVISETISKSKIYGNLELTKYRVTNPKKYFEEKILRKRSRENQ